MKEVRYKKINQLTLSKGLASVAVAVGEQGADILRHSHYRPNVTWRQWKNPWGGSLRIDDVIDYHPSIDFGDLFRWSGVEVIARWSRLEEVEGADWYWGQDNLLRIFVNGIRVDPIEEYIIKGPKDHGNKNKK